MTETQGDNGSDRWWRYGIAPECLKELSESDRRNAKSLNHWFLLWVLAFCTAAPAHVILFGDSDTAGSWRLLPAIIAAATTVFLVRAYVRFYIATKDELLRKVHYESLAIGFGAAFFLGVGFAVLKPITGSLDIAAPMTLVGMLLSYFVSYYLLLNKTSYV